MSNNRVLVVGGGLDGRVIAEALRAVGAREVVTVCTPPSDLAWHRDVIKQAPNKGPRNRWGGISKRGQRR